VAVRGITMSFVVTSPHVIPAYLFPRVSLWPEALSTPCPKQQAYILYSLYPKRNRNAIVSPRLPPLSATGPAPPPPPPSPRGFQLSGRTVLRQNFCLSQPLTQRRIQMLLRIPAVMQSVSHFCMKKNGVRRIRIHTIERPQ